MLKLNHFDDLYCLDVTERTYKHGRQRIGIASDIKTWGSKENNIVLSQKILLHIEHGLSSGLIDIKTTNVFESPVQCIFTDPDFCAKNFLQRFRRQPNANERD